MNDLEFTFESTPWELTLAALPRDGSISALRLLTLLEGEPEEAVEEAFAALRERHITLDAADLPERNGTGTTALRLRREGELANAGQLPGGLEENDPLRLYLEDIADLPAGDISALTARCADGGENAMTDLANALLPRVAALAKEQAGKGVLLLDLIQEGSLGLWQGILAGAYDDMDWWIRQSFGESLTLQARASGLGQKLKTALEDYRAADKRLLTRLGRNPTLEEIALEMGISPEDGAILEQMLQSARTMAKTAEQHREESEEDEQTVENTAYFQSRQRILDMLSTLEEQEAKVLTLRFGLEGGLPLSPEDTGTRLNLTAGEVVDLEAAALAKLRRQG